MSMTPEERAEMRQLEELVEQVAQRLAAVEESLQTKAEPLPELERAHRVWVARLREGEEG